MTIENAAPTIAGEVSWHQSRELLAWWAFANVVNEM
jgi:hypothetical protein